ncbi:MAG TPA: hypothetical protein VFG72_08425 [Marmoricola sp.]|nr:hypothetical protein [Marmoricola sp.]
MSLSLPGAPGISMARRSMLRDGRAARHAAPAKRSQDEPAVLRNGGRLGELADALGRLQRAAGLTAHELATRLVEHLDPSSPLRAVDVFAAGRADLVATYLDGTLDGAGLLAAWQRG